LLETIINDKLQSWYIM